MSEWGGVIMTAGGFFTAGASVGIMLGNKAANPKDCQSCAHRRGRTCHLTGKYPYPTWIAYRQECSGGTYYARRPPFSVRLRHPFKWRKAQQLATRLSTDVASLIRPPFTLGGALAGQQAPILPSLQRPPPAWAAQAAQTPMAQPPQPTVSGSNPSP